MNRDHQLRLHLLHRLAEELFLRIPIYLPQSCNSQEEDICLNSVQLMLDIIKAGTDQDPLLRMLDIEIIGATFLIFMQSGRLRKRLLDQFSEIIIQDRRF